MRQDGVTLVELIISMLLIGLIAAIILPLSATPFQAWAATRERTHLVGLADNALSLMRRDIHQALPNSLRVNANGSAFEMLHIAQAGRYRAYAGDQAGSDSLDFSQPDGSFQVAGPQSAPPAGSRLVIYHTGQVDADAYAGDAVITPASTSLSISSGNPQSLITLSSPWQFPFPSPAQRYYIVDTPISYVCQGGQLLRYSNYAIQSVVASPPAASTTSLVSPQISSCQFSYQSGTATRAGIITLSLGFSGQGETISILEQVYVPNGI